MSFLFIVLKYIEGKNVNISIFVYFNKSLSYFFLLRPTWLRLLPNHLVPIDFAWTTTTTQCWCGGGRSREVGGCLGLKQGPSCSILISWEVNCWPGHGAVTPVMRDLPQPTTSNPRHQININ